MGQLTVGGKQLDYIWHGPTADQAPTLIFLHEGLGSAAIWRDLPERLSQATGCGALVYSRAGYGNSDPVGLPRTVRFMHDEALTTLPQILDAMNIRDAIVVGHSDGGSIALIHAGGASDSRVRGLIVLAPHVLVEEFGLESIRGLADEYRKGELKRLLERYHGANVEQTFWGWYEIWLNPEFAKWNIEEYLPQITVPVFLIQGEDDQYGTIAQVKAIAQGCGGPVRTIMLKDCGHDPHVDQAAKVFEEMTEFVASILAAEEWKKF